MIARQRLAHKTACSVFTCVLAGAIVMSCGDTAPIAPPTTCNAPNTTSTPTPNACIDAEMLQIVTDCFDFHARSVTAYSLAIKLSSATDACDAVNKELERTELLIFYPSFGETGTFQAQNDRVLLTLRHFPAGARSMFDREVKATSGTLTISRFRTTDPIRITGSFDVTFPDGARAAAAFDSPWCTMSNSCPNWNQ